MGWLANRLRRGLTNRSFQAICEEFSSSGPMSGFLAVAIAQAAYPDAVYDAEGCDQFNSLLPRPIVTAKQAQGLSESWLDKRLISYDDCVSRIYGLGTTALIEKAFGSLDDQGESSSEPRSIDPGSMQSPEGREMAESFNSASAESQQRLDRTTAVLNEIILYERYMQLDLAEAAILLAIATLADVTDRDACETNFHAIVDMMFASTEPAEKTLDKAAREALYADAAKKQTQELPRTQNAVRQALSSLDALDEDHPYRQLGHLLHIARVNYLEHTPGHFLPHLVHKCLFLSICLDGETFGADMALAIATGSTDLAETVSAITSAVKEQIEQGGLVVHDGRLLTSSQ
jgi:hypothetical protein